MIDFDPSILCQPILIVRKPPFAFTEDEVLKSIEPYQKKARKPDVYKLTHSYTSEMKVG